MIQCPRKSWPNCLELGKIGRRQAREHIEHTAINRSKSRLASIDAKFSLNCQVSEGIQAGEQSATDLTFVRWIIATRKLQLKFKLVVAVVVVGHKVALAGVDVKTGWIHLFNFITCTARTREKVAVWSGVNVKTGLSCLLAPLTYTAAARNVNWLNSMRLPLPDQLLALWHIRTLIILMIGWVKPNSSRSFLLRAIFAFRSISYSVKLSSAGTAALNPVISTPQDRCFYLAFSHRLAECNNRRQQGEFSWIQGI